MQKVEKKIKHIPEKKKQNFAKVEQTTNSKMYNQIILVWIFFIIRESRFNLEIIKKIIQTNMKNRE